MQRDASVLRSAALHLLGWSRNLPATAIVSNSTSVTSSWTSLEAAASDAMQSQKLARMSTAQIRDCIVPLASRAAYTKLVRDVALLARSDDPEIGLAWATRLEHLIEHLSRSRVLLPLTDRARASVAAELLYRARGLLLKARRESMRGANSSSNRGVAIHKAGVNSITAGSENGNSEWAYSRVFTRLNIKTPADLEAVARMRLVRRQAEAEHADANAGAGASGGGGEGIGVIARAGGESGGVVSGHTKSQGLRFPRAAVRLEMVRVVEEAMASRRGKSEGTMRTTSEGTADRMRAGADARIEGEVRHHDHGHDEDRQSADAASVVREQTLQELSLQPGDVGEFARVLFEEGSMDRGEGIRSVAPNQRFASNQLPPPMVHNGLPAFLQPIEAVPVSMYETASASLPDSTELCSPYDDLLAPHGLVAHRSHDFSPSLERDQNGLDGRRVSGMDAARSASEAAFLPPPSIVPCGAALAPDEPVTLLQQQFAPADAAAYLEQQWLTWAEAREDMADSDRILEGWLAQPPPPPRWACDFDPAAHRDDLQEAVASALEALAAARPREAMALGASASEFPGGCSALMQRAAHLGARGNDGRPRDVCAAQMLAQAAMELAARMADWQLVRALVRRASEGQYGQQVLSEGMEQRVDHLVPLAPAGGAAVLWSSALRRQGRGTEALRVLQGHLDGGGRVSHGSLLASQRAALVAWDGAASAANWRAHVRGIGGSPGLAAPTGTPPGIAAYETRMAVLAADAERGAALRLLDEAQRLGLPPSARLYTGAAAAIAAAAGAGRPQGPKSETMLVAFAGLQQEARYAGERGKSSREKGNRPTRVQTLLAQGAVGRAVAGVLTLMDDFIARRQERRHLESISTGDLPPLSLAECQAMQSAAMLATAGGARDDLTHEIVLEYGTRLAAVARTEAQVASGAALSEFYNDDVTAASSVSSLGVDRGVWAAIREPVMHESDEFSTTDTGSSGCIPTASSALAAVASAATSSKAGESIRRLAAIRRGLLDQVSRQEQGGPSSGRALGAEPVWWQALERLALPVGADVGKWPAHAAALKARGIAGAWNDGRPGLRCAALALRQRLVGLTEGPLSIGSSGAASLDETAVAEAVAKSAVSSLGSATVTFSALEASMGMGKLHARLDWGGSHSWAEGSQGPAPCSPGNSPSDAVELKAIEIGRACQILRRASGLAVLGCAEATRAGGAPPASSETSQGQQGALRDAEIIRWLQGEVPHSAAIDDEIDGQLLRAAGLADAGDVGPAAALVVRAMMQCSLAAGDDLHPLLGQGHQQATSTSGGSDGLIKGAPEPFILPIHLPLAGASAPSMRWAISCMLAQSPPQGHAALALVRDAEADWAATCQSIADALNGGHDAPGGNYGSNIMPRDHTVLPEGAVLPACPAVPLGVTGMSLAATGRTLRAEDSDEDEDELDGVKAETSLRLARRRDGESGSDGGDQFGEADEARVWLQETRAAIRYAWRESRQGRISVCPPGLRAAEISGLLSSAKRAGDGRLAVSVLRLALGLDSAGFGNRDGGDAWPGAVAASAELHARAAVSASVLLSSTAHPQMLDHVGLAPLRTAARELSLSRAHGTGSKEEHAAAIRQLRAKASRTMEVATQTAQSSRYSKLWKPSLGDFTDALEASLRCKSEPNARSVLRLLLQAQQGGAIPAGMIDRLQAEGGEFQSLAVEAAQGTVAESAELALDYSGGDLGQGASDSDGTDSELEMEQTDSTSAEPSARDFSSNSILGRDGDDGEEGTGTDDDGEEDTGTDDDVRNDGFLSVSDFGSEQQTPNQNAMPLQLSGPSDDPDEIRRALAALGVVGEQDSGVDLGKSHRGVLFGEAAPRQSNALDVSTPVLTERNEATDADLYEITPGGLSGSGSRAWALATARAVEGRALRVLRSEGTHGADSLDDAVIGGGLSRIATEAVSALAEARGSGRAPRRRRGADGLLSNSGKGHGITDAATNSERLLQAPPVASLDEPPAESMLRWAMVEAIGAASTLRAGDLLRVCRAAGIKVPDRRRDALLAGLAEHAALIAL